MICGHLYSLTHISLVRDCFPYWTVSVRCPLLTFSHLNLSPSPRTTRDEFRPRQTRQLPRAVDLKGRLLSCQSY